MNTVHKPSLCHMSSHVVTRIKTRKVHLLWEVIHYNHCFLIVESLSETLRASTKTTYSPMSPWWLPDLLVQVAAQVTIQQWHFNNLTHDASEDWRRRNRIWWWWWWLCWHRTWEKTVDVFLAGRHRQIKKGSCILGLFSKSFQSTMKCTNVTGKAPLLSGSPSMCPSCKGGKQRQGQRLKTATHT